MVKKKIPEDPAERKKRIEWLNDHAVWQPAEINVDTVTVFGIDRCVVIEWIYVDPTTNEISDDPERNTTFRVWLEALIPVPPDDFVPGPAWHHEWDWRMDCGGSTLEEALLVLASRVEHFYDETGASRYPKAYAIENGGE